jgi:tryptophanyl-tRNA synthetase
VLHEALSGATRDETLDRFDGQGYGTLKKDLVQLVIDRLAPIQDRYRNIHADEAHLEQVLAGGAERASVVANRTLGRALELTGLA